MRTTFRKAFPYFLPALVLAVSLTSSLIVAGPTPDDDSSNSPTPTPTPNETPTTPYDTLQTSIQTADGAELKNTDSIQATMDRSVTNTPPFIQPPLSFPATQGVATTRLLTLGDIENNLPLTLELTDSGANGATVSVNGAQITYQSSVTFLGADKIPVRVKDSTGMYQDVLITFNVTP